MTWRMFWELEMWGVEYDGMSSVLNNIISKFQPAWRTENDFPSHSHPAMVVQNPAREEQVASGTWSRMMVNTYWALLNYETGSLWNTSSKFRLGNGLWIPRWTFKQYSPKPSEIPKDLGICSLRWDKARKCFPRAHPSSVHWRFQTSHELKTSSLDFLCKWWSNWYTF